MKTQNRGYLRLCYIPASIYWTMKKGKRAMELQYFDFLFNLFFYISNCTGTKY